ncbi:MAG TPA: aldo/keto reductase, partial [Planctomycetaceae bacterium]|nr:aldo/keto reductase [Planctomycetaceae bacterium]
DRLDCYLLHWRGEHPLEETFAGFEQLARDGKILSWGVSNFDESDLDEAWAIVGGDGGGGGGGGGGPMACNQVLYHLKERAIEHAVIPWCEAHGVAVVAYSPFGQGDFPEPESEGGRVLEEIAAAHGATARQVALAFLVQAGKTGTGTAERASERDEGGSSAEPVPVLSVFAIPKAARVEHVEENAGAGELRLSEAESARIDAAFPRGKRRRELPML